MEEKNIRMETEVSIRLDRLVYIVMLAWRHVLKSSLFLALLGVVLTSLVTIVGFCSEERRTKVESEYLLDLFSYEIEGKNLEKDIQNLYGSIQQQENYNANSILMQIDPYNKYVAALTYYVDTEYQIMPEYQYQNIDYGPRLVQMYAEYLTGGEMYSEIAAGLSGAHDVRFIEELFNISAHHSMGMLEIQVCAVDQEMCQEIIDIISLGIMAKYSEAAQMIGDHSLTELNKNISSVVDVLLGETQKQNIQAITDAMVTLEEKQKALEEWEREDIPEAPYSWKSIIKSMLKVAVIGATAGVVLVIAIQAMYYVSGNRILGTPEFQDRCTLKVLGELPEQAEEKCWLDWWIDRIGKVTLRSSDAKLLAAVAVENICMASNIVKDPIQTVALIGSVSLEELERLMTEFQRHAGNRLQFLPAGNPLASASAANLIRQTDAVVLIEKQRTSTYTDVVKECEQMSLWGKNVLGIVFTNVDAK